MRKNRLKNKIFYSKAIYNIKNKKRRSNKMQIRKIKSLFIQIKKIQIVSHKSSKKKSKFYFLFNMLMIQNLNRYFKFYIQGKKIKLKF